MSDGILIGKKESTRHSSLIIIRTYWRLCDAYAGFGLDLRLVLVSVSKIDPFPPEPSLAEFPELEVVRRRTKLLPMEF